MGLNVVCGCDKYCAQWDLVSVVCGCNKYCALWDLVSVVCERDKYLHPMHDKLHSLNHLFITLQTQKAGNSYLKGTPCKEIPWFLSPGTEQKKHSQQFHTQCLVEFLQN